MSTARSGAGSSAWGVGGRGVASGVLRVGLVLVLVLVVLLVVGSGSAFAAKSVGGFVGGVRGADVGYIGGSFNQPRGVAVYTGVDAGPGDDKLFVVEAPGSGTGNTHRVQRLDGSGNFELAWGKDVDGSDPGTGFEVCSVASSCQTGAPAVGSGKGEFSNPGRVAVDGDGGWVYVMDRGNFRVQKFDLDGNFVLMFGRDVNQTAIDAAAPQAQRDVCTEASGDVCKAGVAGQGAGQFGSATLFTFPDVVVDPVGHDVFVADPGSGAGSNRRVMQYDSSGAFVRAWGFGVANGVAQFQTCTTACQAGNAAGTANGQFANASPLSLAVDSQRVVYALDPSSGTVANRVVRFDADLAPGVPGDASGALLAAINPTTGPAPNPLIGPVVGVSAGSSGGSIAIDPDSDGAGPDEESLLAVRDPSSPTTAPTVVQELDIPTQAGEAPGDAVVEVDRHTFAPRGLLGQLAVNSATGDLYSGYGEAAGNFPACAAENGGSACHGLFVFNESGSVAPSATITGALDVDTDSASLSGTVTPNGVARYRFEVSADGSNWTAVGADAYASGSSPVPVSAQVTGLDPSTLYRVRIVASKYTSLSTINSASSADGLFVTDGAAPVVTTLGSTDRTDTSVRLRGLVDPNGAPTSYRFEYGPAGGTFTRRVPIPDGNAGSGNTADMVVQHVTGLLPATAYQYRIVAANGSGEDVGDTVTFTTRGASDAANVAQARAYELVSPADKIGGIGVGMWYGGPRDLTSVGFAAHEGERFAAHGSLGSMLVNSAQGYANDWALAERGSSSVGWRSHPLITHPASNEEVARFLGVYSASEDLSTLVVRTNAPSVLDVFPEMATWGGLQIGPSYVADWSGRWELFGPTDLSQIRPAAVNQNDLWDPAVSADGKWVAGSSNLDTASGKSVIGGLAGSGDPSHPARSDQVAGRAAYLADLSAGPSDEFVPSGSRANVGVCAAGTAIPRRDGSTGKLDGQLCPAPLGDSDDRLVSDRGATLQAVDVDISNVGSSVSRIVSQDGSRVFFMSPDPLAGGVPNGTDTFCSGAADLTLCPPQLYVRQRNADGSVSTRWISRAEDGLFGSQDASLTGTVRFEGASRDGSRVYFRTNSPLTADDPNGAGVAPPPGGVTTGSASNDSWDLYMYEVSAGDPGDGTLTRISGGPGGDGDCNVTAGSISTAVDNGALRFVSDDGARAYFTCAAPLPGVNAAGSGTIVEPDGVSTTTTSANLYAYDASDGAASWSFVSRLPRSANPATAAACATTGMSPQAPLGAFGISGGTEYGFLPIRSNCVKGTADGAFVTFWTTGRLTADDPDGGSADIYGYDVEADELTRLTAPQGGVGNSYPCGNIEEAATIACFGDGGFDHGEDARQRSALPALGVATTPLTAGDRVAFFQSRSRLVVEDVDDAYDVYEWRNGDLSLISTGSSAANDGAFYKGNDRTGRNVYFATRDALSWQDFDAVADVYTARVGGGIPQPTPPAVCEVLAHGCHSGGGSFLPVQLKTTSLAGSPSGENASPGVRKTLRVGNISRKARRRAARRGVLAVRVKTSRAGLVRVLARAKIGKRTQRVAGRTVRVREAGAVTVKLRLNRAAKRRLRSGRRLNLSIQVRSPGARTRTATVRLKRGRRS